MFRIFSQDRADSPVIGVILMVAITVILAAVIGAFVLGLGDDLGSSSSPSAQLSTSTGETNKTVELSHQGGSDLNLDDEISVIVNGSVDNEASFSPGSLSAGTSSTITIDDSDIDPGEEIDLSLRHDPSGSVIYSGTVEVGTDTT